MHIRVLPRGSGGKATAHLAIRMDDPGKTRERQTGNPLPAETGPGASDSPRWLFRAEEEERRRIAQQLHDTLNQLAAVKLCLDEIEELTEDAREEIDQGRALIDGAIEEIRHVSHELRPRALENLGLPGATRSLCEELAHRTGLRVECTWEDLPEPPSGDRAIGLYRTLQELLRNVERHAGAQQVQVIGACREGRLLVTVRDDGCGFDPVEAEERGTGLKGLRERVQLLGGRVSIRSASDHGTEITVELPFANRGGSPSHQV